MASTKCIYIHDDVAELLKKEDNISSLINSLLREYFKTKSDENLSIEDRKKLLEIKKIELDALMKKGEVLYGSA